MVFTDDEVVHDAIRPHQDVLQRFTVTTNSHGKRKQINCGQLVRILFHDSLANFD